MGSDADVGRVLVQLWVRRVELRMEGRHIRVHQENIEFTYGHLSVLIVA